MPDGQKTRITVNIYGHHYTIIGTETESHISEVAKMVDGKMREISLKNPMLDTNKLAVLTAVNTIHDYVKLKDELDRLKAEIKQQQKD